MAIPALELKVQVTEGTFRFPCPEAGKPCETWYKIFGDLNSLTTPLILIHDGSGSTSDYLLFFRAFSAQYNIPIILYDHIGNGRSTHLPEKKGDEDFWVESLFHRQLASLISSLGLDKEGKRYDLLGQSWGGMMGSTFMATRPRGLRKGVLSNAPASMALWIQAANAYLSEMPEWERGVIERAQIERSWEGVDFETAMAVFGRRHVCRVEWPEEMQECMRWMKEDSTVGDTMNGPSEFTPKSTGTHRNWSAIEAVKNINVPLLVINGTNECASDEATQPFLDGIRDVKHVKLSNSRHAPMFEEKEECFKVIADFLLGDDGA